MEHDMVNMFWPTTFMIVPSIWDWTWYLMVNAECKIFGSIAFLTCWNTTGLLKYKLAQFSWISDQNSAYNLYSLVEEFGAHLGFFFWSELPSVPTQGQWKQLKSGCAIWQYRMWSFQGRDTKLERFLAENGSQMKLLNFDNWSSGELSIIRHHFRK